MTFEEFKYKLCYENSKFKNHELGHLFRGHKYCFINSRLYIVNTEIINFIGSYTQIYDGLVNNKKVKYIIIDIDTYSSLYRDIKIDELLRD